MSICFVIFPVPSRLPCNCLGLFVKPDVLKTKENAKLCQT